MVEIIHCFWMGGNLPVVFRDNIERWRRLNPGFEIKLWTDSNVDLSGLECSSWSPELRKPSMVSDLVRLHKVYESGGWWLDMDVELFLSLEDSRLDGGKLILGYMYDCALGTAVFYAPPRHPYIAGLLDRYRLLPAGKVPVNNSVFTEYFVNEVPGFLLTGREWENESCHVFPKEMFEQPSLPSGHGLSMHHCAGAWMGKTLRNNFLYNHPIPALSRIEKWAKRKVRTRLALAKNEFRSVYESALRGQACRFDPAHYYQTGEIEP